jgi:hypothetical protein
MLSGHLRNTLPSAGFVDFVRDTKVMNGCAIGRITHVVWATPLLGRAEVAITETLVRNQVP